MTKTRLFCALGALIFSAGCATQSGGPSPQTPPGQAGAGQTQPIPPPQQQPAPAKRQREPQPPQKTPPKNASQVSSPAVMSLLGSADTLAKSGHMEASASTLERALNLDPRNPFIYQRLAAVRLAQGETGQAEQMAMKSNSVSNNNPFVESSNWRLIAEARKQAGDVRGAEKASAQAVNFRQTTSQYEQ